ncbi:hypothetical protein [Neorhodopirellula lusitana]|uniref:hypothetical protein n=1 Tax=Neorhodopirellula lusitana TaxID=445327 RepID=UPI0038513D80
MFIRFVTDQLDADTDQPLGIFGAAYRLLEDDQVPDYSRTEIRTTLNWFKTNLPIPDRFARSRKPHRQDNGICWFKTRATDCMRHIRYLAQLVAEHDIIVRELLTDAPGYMIYEDDSQVVAQPFSSTPQ